MVIGLIPQLAESVLMDIPARSLVPEGQGGARPGNRTEARSVSSGENLKLNGNLNPVK